MTPFEPRTQAAIDAALGQIMTTASVVVDRVCELLGTLALASKSIAERDAMLGAQFDLRRNLAGFHRVFKDTLRTRVQKESEPVGAVRGAPAATDWQSLTLVDDHEMEERMSSDRMGQLIAHECEWERRELAAYVGSLLRTGHADEERNPLRPEVIGHALYRAVESTSGESEIRRTLAREIGKAMAKAMPECYRRVLADLQARGIQPVSLSVRTFEGPGTYLHGVNTGYQTGAGELHRSGGLSQPGSLQGLAGAPPAFTPPAAPGPQACPPAMAAAAAAAVAVAA